MGTVNIGLFQGNSYASINSSAWAAAQHPPSAVNTTNQPSFTGVIERKAVMQTSGRKATMRNWKTFYTVVISHSVKFYKDEQAFRNVRVRSLFSCVGLPNYQVDIAID